MLGFDRILETLESVPLLYRFIVRVWGTLPQNVKVRVLRVVNPSVTLGAVAVIVKDESDSGRQVLLGFHTYHRRQGTPWALLGGALKSRDSDTSLSSGTGVPARAIVREIKEEAGLDVEVVRLIAVDTDWRLRTMDFYFECALPGGQAWSEGCLTAEVSVLRWFPLSDLPEDMFPQHRHFLRSVWPQLESLPAVPWSAH
jgi:8-oxo-dGTP pyrophosphatase MutT (NUDIX family)